FENAELTAQKIMAKVPACHVEVGDLNDQAAMAASIKTSDILANATKVGMNPHPDQSNIKDLSVLRPDLVVTDTVY
ncbi:shikimate dehydrogenase, partial [Staphylococcus epidermidis]